MHGFEDVTIGWRGEQYVVPANRQMLLIAKIEDALSGDTGQQALTILFRKEGPPYTRLAAAYGAALRHAGAKVTDDEVYLSIMTDLAHGTKAEAARVIQGAIIALLSIISPPAAAAVTGKAEPAGKKD
jgi:hypothetical protein